MRAHGPRRPLPLTPPSLTSLSRAQSAARTRFSITFRYLYFILFYYPITNTFQFSENLRLQTHISLRPGHATIFFDFSELITSIYFLSLF